MFAVLDNIRVSASTRQDLLQSLLRECQQPNQPLLNQLIEYYFHTESPNALLLIKQYNDTGKEQSKILIEHLNTQGLKPSNRHSSSSFNSESYSNEEQERVTHIMKVFRMLCLIIHSQVPGLPTLIKDSLVLPNCLNAITKCKDDPNILAQACYFFAALTAILPGEIVQQTESIINVFKATCKYLYKNKALLRQLSIQTNSHSLENVQLWIVNQSAHALFYTLYTVYPCNFLYHIQREFQRNENLDVFEHIFIPMFQRVRFNARLIDSDRKRELDKVKRLRPNSSNTIYDARKLSLDPLFGRESPTNHNWMHQEMKKILPFSHFKRQSPTNSSDQLSDGLRNSKDITSPSDNTSKRSNSSPLQKFKEKIKTYFRPAPSPSSTAATTYSTTDTNTTTNKNNNTLSIPNVSSSLVSSPASPATASDMRAVKTMPELQSNNDLSSSSSSTPTIRRSDEKDQIFVRSVINTISTNYDQNLPSHWRKILGRYDSNLLEASTPQRPAIFYVSPSEHSLDNQPQQQKQSQQQQQQQVDDSSPTSTNEKRQRCVSASCASSSSQQVHSPVLAAPTTSTDDILPRTQSLSTKQRTRHSATLSTTDSFHQRHLIVNQIQYEEDDDDDNLFMDQTSSIDSWTYQIPLELYICPETKMSIIDELTWNDHEFISIPHFDFNDIVSNNCSSNELKQFDRLYKCHSCYEVFLTEQYKDIWERLWSKQKSFQKHTYEIQTTHAFLNTLHFEIQGHLNDETNIYENDSKCLSDENSLLGGKVVELGKVTSRRKQTSTNAERDTELEELEKSHGQLRKIVNNETLKLNNLLTELDDNDKEAELAAERSEQLRLVTQNITHLNELNQQLECQYLRFTDDMLMGTHNNLLPSHLTRDEDDELNQFKSASSTTTTNGRDETSELDSISFSEEHRQDIEDFNPQQDDDQPEKYDQLLADIIEILNNQNKDNDITQIDIENKAYEILLEYMESKENMQDYLVEHNTRYIDLYLEAQADYMVQVENELSLNKSILEQMPNVAM
ncbi:unnamed protein product [Rotaria socialis]|uniref:Uncharacterized protein n=1 Tax=Rotaria socialis TaxID=392032 RepID=A0A818MR83_9BILA|nr:unnamed protein product [Rotaria socialis]CAF3463578.1 unnamed protein product [Rotaria socialis]CAF3593527.1 unnamed protein product [Rotaria socialis]CAF4098322.1 unnamed protein product [Rotaria socialis]CAF4217028.1 unnamed protein product [Rotaria socialis]